MPANSSRPRPCALSSAWLGSMRRGVARRPLGRVDQRLQRAGHARRGGSCRRRAPWPAGRRPAPRGVTWIAAGTLPEAPLMRPSVTSATLKPLPCSTASGGVSLCSSGMPLACGPWKRTTATRSRSQLAGLEGRQQRLLAVEHARRRLDHVAVVGHRRHLDHARPRLPVQQLAGRRWRGTGRPRGARTLPSPLAAGRSRHCSRSPRSQRGHARVGARCRRRDGAHVGVHQAGVEQLADHEAGAAGGLELVHVGRCRWDRRAPAAAPRATARRSRSSRSGCRPRAPPPPSGSGGWSSRRWPAARPSR